MSRLHSQLDFPISFFYQNPMQRTTILLPDDLRRRAEREAKALGISLSELIRRKLAQPEQEASQQRPRFFTRKPWSGAGPSDTAINHDSYLYES
jgi:hypothetical protein